MQRGSDHDVSYRSRADVHRHFRRLTECQTRTLRVTRPIEDSDILDEILERAREAEITIAALHIGHGDCLREGALPSVLRRLYRPNDPMLLGWSPLETVVLDVRCGSADDLRGVLASLREHTRAIAGLRDEYSVAFEARLGFSHADAGLLVDVVQALVERQFTVIELQLELPDPRAVDVEQIKQQLAAFCDAPIARHPALRITRLPFCFLPSRHFRPLYRGALAAIPSQAHLYRQQAFIREVAAAEHRWLEPCRGCRRRAACYALTKIGERPEYRPHLVPSEETAVAFVGGSLTAADLREHASADLVFTAPAEQGDVFAAVLEGFTTLLIVDGYFFQRYALTTFELLVALLENVDVFGAASLGALRALELGDYGMRGDGYVLRCLRDHEVVPYHVVAQTYDAEDRPVTEPLVAIQRFLELAEDAHVIDGGDREHAYALARSLHFSELTYRRLFRVWAASPALGPGAADRLVDFHHAHDRGAFDVKRQDALALLGSFRARLAEDGPDYSRRTLQRARDSYLARLRAKFVDGHDRSLAPDWRDAPDATTSGGRARPLSETLALARAFFADLGVVVADTSHLDEAHYFMVNVVFVPFFFLEYGNSAGSGYGESLEQALVSAYGEVLERIPCGTLRTQFADRDEVRAPEFPFQQLPFYASLTPESSRWFVDDQGRLRARGYLECSDLITGRNFAIPEHGARLPSSCGMASGNHLLEAILYGLYEVVEHDVYACHETRALMEELRHQNLDRDLLRDEACRALVSDLTARGHQVHFFYLLNRYDLPVVLTAFYEADRELVFSGQCCRLDLQEAMVHSFHEALNGHYVSYFGSRDDRRGFEQQSSSSPLRFLQRFVGRPRRFPAADSRGLSLAEQLEVVLDRLVRSGVEHVFALDLGPHVEHGCAVAKVVVPGMDYRNAGRRTESYYRKCVETHRLVTGVDLEWTPASVQRRFRRPSQRFFKA